MRFASFISGGLTTMAVINQPERKLAKRISVQWGEMISEVPDLNLNFFTCYICFFYCHYTAFM